MPPTDRCAGLLQAGPPALDCDLLCFIPDLPQPAEAPSSRVELMYKVADWQAGYRVMSLTQEDYLVVFI